MKLRDLKYTPRRWAWSYLMRLQRAEINDGCTFSRSEIIDDGVRLEVVAWRTNEIVLGTRSKRLPGECVCGVPVDKLHALGGFCVHCGRDIEPGWYKE